MNYQLWVNEERTVLLRVWGNGEVEIALRDSPNNIWGPPIRMLEEREQ